MTVVRVGVGRLLRDPLDVVVLQIDERDAGLGRGDPRRGHVGDDRSRLGVAEQVADLRRRPAGLDRRHDHPRPLGPDDRHEVLDVVAGDDAHVVTGLQAPGHEAVPEGVGLGVELGPGERAAPVVEREVVRGRGS